MRILLETLYQNTAGVRIPAGEYDSGDEALHGLAGYLVRTRHAVAIAEESEVTPENPPATDEGATGTENPIRAETDAENSAPAENSQTEGETALRETLAQLDALTKPVLVELAVSRGLTVPADARKADIIQAILDAQVEAEADEHQ